MRNGNQDGKTDNDLMKRLTTFISTTEYMDLPEEMSKIAKQAMIDTIGVALAGWKEPAVEVVKKVYASSTRDGYSHPSSLWGERIKLESEKAAIINGTATHVLDFDDASIGVVIHPSAPILSAVIPLAEENGSSGEEVITAYSVGTEVMIRLGQVMGYRHYELGWHATGTLGTMGAAAACANLLKLNLEQCANTVAIAASMAGGLQKNFGSMTKSLHVGLAASHAIQSAKLAKSGFTGNTEIFGSRGVFNAFSGGLEEEIVRTNMEAIHFGKPYDLLESGLSVKKFPCCYGSHRFIHGALSLKQEYDLSLDDIEEIVVTSQRRSLVPLVHKRPKTGLQGKFSAEYTVLTAIADGNVTLSSFEDSEVQRPAIQDLFSSVKVLEVKEKEEEINLRLPIEIQIKTKSGQTVKKAVLHAPGSKETPLSEQEHREKWVECIKHYTKLTKSIQPNIQVEGIANELYNKGLQIELYGCFQDWLSCVQGVTNYK
ncbi:MmgE/PrpD family protein [Halalkalibacter krulwichiae]|uniref:2-methylcitrate dehydratase n=1 Tax=Halalkalibacter krulwichiae TaxID=199441 RepID=A0A1X9MGM9_9BACI|nr:MmgE/PrpD family protein [Halalkalibacter krulwichiae]ARK32588.1 2-methylcitrate dehydratase [Halalkalibacter krulwichiae]